MPDPKVHKLQFRALLDADAEAGGEEGFLRARVCELDAVDKIGLVIARGGLVELRREAVISSWQHSAVGYGAAMPPVGLGHVFEEGNFLMAEGQYNLAMQAGRDAYEAVKMMQDTVEFSILLRVLEEEMEHTPEGDWRVTVTRYDVSEWSPCQRGVSYNTGVDELRATPTDGQIADPRRDEMQRRVRSLRIRQIEARGT